MTDTFMGSVWVVTLGLKWVGFDVFEGIIHKTSIASAIGVVAVDELLLREGCKLVAGDLPGTLKRTSGRERPARTALSLVLDWGNSTLTSPVDSVGEVCGWGPEGLTKI